MIALWAALVAHVPQYDGCDHNCCHPPHGPTTSQVAYLRGSGGVEYDISELKGEEVIHFNIVFKKPYDTSLFSVYAGCGGCASEKPFHWDEPRSLPLALRETYYDAKLEAFTQHSYYEVIRRPIDENGDDQSPRFNTSVLSNCSSKHFSVRLIAHDNVTEDIVYGVVVGCEGLSCERFTALELLSFPLYVIRNHGPAWNEATWTLILIALTLPLVMAFILWWWHGGFLAFHVPISVSFPRQLAMMQAYDGGSMHWARLRGVCWVWSPRCVAYAVATYAITVDILESFAHVLIAAKDVEPGHSSYGMFTWWLGIKVLLLLAVTLPWGWAREVPEKLWRAAEWRCACGWFEGIGPYSPFWAQGFWSLLDIAIGLGSFFLGAGFYVYPVAATVAGFIRLVEWVRGDRTPPPPCERDVYVERKVKFTQLQDTSCAY